MSSNTNIKLFLLSSIDYRNRKDQTTKYIESMLSITRRFGEPLDHGHTHLEGHDVFYHETEDVADPQEVNAFKAIEKARGLAMIHVEAFEADTALLLPANINDAVVRDVQSNLFYDSHACFLLITEVTIGVNARPDLSDITSQIFNKRSSFENLGLGLFMEDSFARAKKKVITTCKTAMGPAVAISEDDISFSEEKTLPLLMSGESFPVDLNSFRNEEIVSLISREQSISVDYPGAFFHPGWNYTIVAGFPYEVLVNTLHMMIRAQTFFFCLGYMKDYFSNELNITLKKKSGIGESDVDNAEEVRLAFYDLLAKFNSYKNRLFPKYHSELCALMERWHCYDDVEYIKSCIELNLQAKDRIHNSRVERQNERQNSALAFIAFLQLISIYGAFADGSSLFSKEAWLFHLGTATLVLSLMAFLVLTRYIKTAVVLGLLSAVAMAAVGQLGLLG